MVTVCPSKPKMTSWWATSPGRRNAMNLNTAKSAAPHTFHFLHKILALVFSLPPERLLRIISAVLMAVPEGASIFWS